jgi:hypothetical protein
LENDLKQKTTCHGRQEVCLCRNPRVSSMVTEEKGKHGNGNEVEGAIDNRIGVG